MKVSIDRTDQVTGVNGSFMYYSAGNQADIYILDTGVFGEHNDFGGRVTIGGYTDCSSGICRIDANNCNITYANQPYAWEDLNGHGTQVAGVAAGVVHGVAKGVTVSSVKVLGDCTFTNGSGTSNTVIAGLNFVATYHSGPSIINLSAHLVPKNTVVDNAVKNAIAQGVTVVASAGDVTNVDACTFSPGDLNANGGYPGFILVSGSLRNDQMDSGSAYGKCVSIFAPDQSVLTTGAVWGSTCSSCPWRNVTTSSTTAEVFSGGNSVSASLVSGIAAMYFSNHPTATPAQVESAVLGVSSVGVLSNNTHNSSNRLANSCVAGNNAALDPNAPGWCASGGGGGGGGGLTVGQKAAIQSISYLLLYN